MALVIFKHQRVMLQRLLFFGEVDDERRLTEARCMRSTRPIMRLSGVSMSSRLGDKPTLQELDYFTYTSVSGTEHRIHIISTVATQWRSLGLALGFEGYELDIIEINNPNKVELRSQDLLAKWLKRTTSTWETLLQAMKKAQCAAIAEQVRKALVGCGEEPPLTYTWQSTIFPNSLTNSFTWRSIMLSAMLILSLALAILTFNYSTPEPTINHLSLPNSLLQYQVYLCSVYNGCNYSKHSKPSEFIAVNRPEHPLNLVLVHKERQIDTSHKQQHKFAFHGKVDEIQKQKTPIKIEKIGSTLKSKMAAHFVLIEGAAGIGKSTLCWQLCRLWSEGKLQHEWDLVVLVEIRDEATRKATSVYDLLFHPDDSIRQSIAQEVQKQEGEGLMIIFDGYDELSDDQRSEFSLVQKILSNRVLYKATIVVTSRPIATKGLSAQFRQTLDQHVVIAGFNESDIQTYITLACKDNIEMLEAFRSYISSRPFILSVMYNPLHCTIVTELYIWNWQDGRKFFAPNTLTELYAAFVLHLLKRNLPSHKSSTIDKLSDLPRDVFHNVTQLAELAASGLEENKYIYGDVPCNTLGLMVSVRQIYEVRSDKAAYMFLHLTLQEYLSAFYWSHQPQQKQIDFLYRQNISHIMQLRWLGIDYYDKDLNISYSVHWPHLLFLAGLTKLFFPLELIMLMNNSDVIYIGPMCQVLFETQCPQNVSRVFRNRRLKVDLSDMIDWFVIGYCISNSDSTSSWLIPSVGPPKYLQSLSDGLHYSGNTIDLDSNSNQLVINMTVTFAKEYFEIFPRLYPFTKAISELSACLFVDDFPMLHNLSHYCPNLKVLRLRGPFALTESPQLPKETLVTVGLILPQFSVVFDSLHEYPSLSELHLFSTNSRDLCPLMKKNFQKLAGKLTKLSIDRLFFGESCVNGLAHLLNSSLIYLRIEQCTILSNEFDKLSTAIATSELKQLEFRNLNIDLEMGKSLALLLKLSKTLVEVTAVLEYRINCDIVRLLVEAMTHSSVKNLITNEYCREAVADISYPKDRVTFISMQ